MRGVDVDEVVARRERAPDGRRGGGGAGRRCPRCVIAPRLDRRVLLHRQVRRPGGRDAAVEVRGRHPVVDELDPGERVVRVHLVDEPLVHRDVGVVPQPALDVAAGVRVGMEVDLLRADDRPAAFRLDAAHHRVRGRVAVAHAVAVRHLEEAVARRHRPEADRLEEHVVARVSHGFGNRLRAMISRMMSLVPSQISSSFASRSHFWTRRVAHVTGAAERLRRRPRREPRRLRRGELRHRRLGRERLARVGEVGGVVGQEPRLVELQLRVGEPERHRLELVDRPAERLALASRTRPRARAPRGRRRASIAASCTRATSNTCISPLNPCPSPPRRRSSGTKHSSKRSSPAGKQRLPIFGSRAPRTKPSSPRSTTKAVMPFERAARLDRREDDADVGDRRVADELLVAVEHVAAVDAAGSRLDRGRVGAVLRLGDRDRAGRRLGAAERRQPPLLLLVGLPSASIGPAKKPPCAITQEIGESPHESSSITAQRSRQARRSRRRRTRAGRS